MIAAFYFNYRAQGSSQELVEETWQNCQLANLIRTVSLVAICLSVDQLLLDRNEGGTWLNMFVMKCRTIDLVFGGAAWLLVLYHCVSYVHDGSEHSGEAGFEFSQGLQKARCNDHFVEQEDDLGKGAPFRDSERSQDCKFAGSRESSLVRAPGTDDSHKAVEHLWFRHSADSLGHAGHG